MGAHPLVRTKLSRWQILANDFPRDLHSSGQAAGQQSYDTRPVGHARARASAKPRPLARTSRTPKRRRVTSLSSTMRSHAFQSTIRWRASPNMKAQRRQGQATVGVARERLKRQRRLNTMFKFCGQVFPAGGRDPDDSLSLGSQAAREERGCTLDAMLATHVCCGIYNTFISLTKTIKFRA